MKNYYKISIILIVSILTISVVTAADNSTDTHASIRKNSDTPGTYTVSPNGKGVGKNDGNLFETIDYTEKHEKKAVINLKNGTYNFSYDVINGTYYSNRYLGKHNITKNISFIGNNTVFDADDVRFFNVRRGVTAEFVNINFTNGYREIGGSIYSEGNVILRNCSFINSSSLDYGGTLYLKGNNKIENCQFINSVVSASQEGGIIYLLKNNQTYLKNVKFINNTVDCVVTEEVPNLYIDNTMFVNNRCNYLACISGNKKLPTADIIINNCKIENNTDVNSVFALFSEANRTYIQNSSIVNNKFTNIIGQFYIPYPNTAYIKNNTYIGNNLSSYMKGSLNNSIVYNNPLKGTLRVVAEDILNTTVKTGKASIYVDNNFYGRVGVFDGYIYVRVNNLSKGKHSVNIKYSDNTNSFKAVEKTFNVTVADKVLTKVITGDKYAFAGSKIKFNASVFDYNNRPVTVGRMVIKINGKTQASITLKNTNRITYNYTVPNYTARDYRLDYVYVGDEKYARYEANKTLHVFNQTARIIANSMVNYQEQTVTLKVKVVGKETGILAQAGIVGFRLNAPVLKITGTPIMKQVKNGEAIFVYKIPKKVKADKYQVIITYSRGRNIHLATSTNISTLTVKDHTTRIKIKTKTLKQSRMNKVIAEVKDSVSNIKSGRASLYLNDVKVSETEIENGQAIFNYYVLGTYLGKYNMKVTAKGTYTDENSVKSTIMVVK